MTYSVSTGERETTTVVTLTGPLTITTMFALQSELHSLKPQVLVLELSAVPYMDSAGLGMVMNYYVSALKGGRKLLIAGVSDRIGALLELTRVNQILAIFPSTKAAEASL